MNSTTILLAALLCTIVAPVFAADAEGDPGHHRRIATERMPSMRGVEGMHPGAGALRRHARPVKGAPYSAEVVSERQQNLADGNQIVNKTRSFSYRDSAGRTRHEVHNAEGDVMAVAISDPVAGLVLMLDTRTKTGTRITIGAGANLAANLPPEERKEGKLAPMDRNEIIIRHAGDGGRIEAPNLRLGPLAAAMADRKWAAKAATRELGTHDIKGIKADGKLRSYDIPAGEVGNRNAITVSDEIWYSAELQVTLMSKHSDPRAGDNVYRLTAIKRDEPAASLFAAPPDYTITDRSPGMQPTAKKAP